MIIADLFRLTKREYFADFFITPPLTLVFAIYSMMHSWGPWWIPQLFLGIFLWSFYEYALHRWVLHGVPLFADIHALHHRNQKDYIAVPPCMTLLSYAGFWVLFGMRSSALMVGFSVGYIIYSSTHTAFHYLRFEEGSWLFAGDQRHVKHHRYEDVCYGVTNSFWDRLFRTEEVH